MRIPFDPPYMPEDLSQLDKLHDYAGMGMEWLSSEVRGYFIRSGSTPMNKKAAMELRFGKGPEHEELCDLFAEFAFQLDRRLPDGDHKTRMLSQLDFASQYAHEAVKDVYPPITGIKEHGENVAIKNEDLYDTEIPDTRVSLAEEVNKAVKKASEYAFEEDAASHPVTPAMKVYRAEKDAISNSEADGLKRKEHPPVIDE